MLCKAQARSCGRCKQGSTKGPVEGASKVLRKVLWKVQARFYERSCGRCKQGSTKGPSEGLAKHLRNDLVKHCLSSLKQKTHL